MSQKKEQQEPNRQQRSGMCQSELFHAWSPCCFASVGLASVCSGVIFIPRKESHFLFYHFFGGGIHSISPCN